jgi:hypothetical protein
MNNDCTLPSELRRTLQVNAITFEYTLGDLGAYVDSGLLIAMGHFAHQIGLPALFRHFIQLKQKKLRHDPIDKLLTFFVSLVDGCGYTSDIDTALKPYPALAQAWTVPGFAGQRVVNETLHLLTWSQVKQIDQVFQALFEQQSLARQQPRNVPLIVDVDTMGLRVSPGSHAIEWAELGYFPKAKGQKGLQFSAAFIGANFRECLGGFLAPGYAHILNQMPALLELIEKRLGSPPRRGDLLRQRARHLQAQARTCETSAASCTNRVQHHYQQISARQERAGVHQAQIDALKVRLRRLPKRAKRLQKALAHHQARMRWYRQREHGDLKAIERLRERAVRYQREAAALREEAQALLELAAQPVALGKSRVILLRGDAGLGTADTITILSERGYLFVLKGRDPRTAHKLVNLAKPADWQPVDAHLRAAEIIGRPLPGCPYSVRLVLCERTNDKGKASYYFLVSNLSPQTYAAPELVRFYNDRQTIEAFNKVIGTVLFLRHLRTGDIIANYAVAQLAMLAQDFLSCSAHTFFTGTPYEGIAIRELVQKGLRVVARVSWPQPGFCRTELSSASPYARAFVAGPRGTAGQPPLPFVFEPVPKQPKTE